MGDDGGRLINPDALAPPRGYSHGLLFPAGGRPLFVAGQVATDARGEILGQGLVAQFERSLENVLAVVMAAGGRPESLGTLRIFVTDIERYAAEREAIGHAYRRHMGRHFPAMSLVEVSRLLEPGALVEIEGIAII